jgi:hypothetical protein
MLCRFFLAELSRSVRDIDSKRPRGCEISIGKKRPKGHGAHPSARSIIWLQLECVNVEKPSFCIIVLHGFLDRCESRPTPSIAKQTSHLLQIVMILLLEERADFFDAVPVIPSRLLNSIIVQSCPDRFSVLFCYFNIHSNYWNCIVCVPFMWSNAAMTNTTPIVPSHRRVNQAAAKQGVTKKKEEKRTLRVTVLCVANLPGVVPSGYERSGLLIHTLQLIPTITFVLCVKSTRKYISGVLKSMSFSHTFCATMRENPILSYTLH